MGDDLLLELLPAAADVRIREIDESRSKPAKRIQNIHRALHDIGKVPPADPRHLSRWSAVHSAVAGQEREIHAAANDLHWRPDRAYDTFEQRGLAGAGLAGEPVHLAALNCKADAVDGLHLAFESEAVNPVKRPQVTDRQDRLRVDGRVRSRSFGLYHGVPPALRRRLRGSMYSLVDTASRNSPMNVMITAMVGKAIHHQTPATIAAC